MSLNEEQIQRYARQILLPTVGGVGQERLLASVVAVEGTGLAAETALTYLRISGVRTEVLSTTGQGVRIHGREPGEPRPHEILLFERGLGFAAREVCATCRAQALDPAEPVAGMALGARAVLLGSLAAAVMQRLLLGEGPGLGQLRFDLDSEATYFPRTFAPCSHGAAS